MEIVKREMDVEMANTALEAENRRLKEQVAALQEENRRLRTQLGAQEGLGDA